MHSRVCGEVEWCRREEGVELLGHHHALSPMEGALGAGEALKGVLEMLAEDPDALKVWARFECRNDPKESGDFIG